MTHVYAVYIAVDIYLIIFTFIILTRLNRDMGSEYETKIMRRMIYAYLIVMIFDILWAMTMGTQLDFNIIAVNAINAVYWIFLTVGCYYWLLFVTARLHPTFVYSKSLKLLISLPAAAAIVINGLSVFAAWIFNIDTSANVGVLFWIQALIDYAYLVIPAVDAARCAYLTHFKSRRAEYMTYFLCMLIPLIAALVEDMLKNIPLGALSIFVVVLILFLTIQNGQINNDALTLLNNRRRMDTYLEGRIESVSERHPLALFIMDINNFKYINDTFGHVEGDKALKIAAEALRKAAERFDAFVARYGGDEFCLISQASRYKPEEIEDGLRSILEETQRGRDEELPYTLTMSIGHAICSDPDSSTDNLIKAADIMLYRRKSQWYADNDISSGHRR